MWQSANFDDPHELRWYEGDPADLFGVLAELLDRPAWHAKARCRGRSDVTWFPGRGERSSRAVEVCSTCPVREDCRNYAMAQDPLLDGIWAGGNRAGRTAMRLNEVA